MSHTTFVRRTQFQRLRFISNVYLKYISTFKTYMCYRLARIYPTRTREGVCICVYESVFLFFFFFFNQRHYWIDTLQSRRRGPKRPSCVHVACVTIHELRAMRFEQPRTKRLAPDRAIRFIRAITFEITELREQTPRNIAGMSIFASMTKLHSVIRKCTVIPILCALCVCMNICKWRFPAYEVFKSVLLGDLQARR